MIRFILTHAFLACIFVGGVSEKLHEFGPSPSAVSLQIEINKSINARLATFTVPAGDYYFGNTSLILYRANNFTLQGEGNAGSVFFWFCIGSGILVQESSNLTLNGFSVDYDPPAHYQATILRVKTLTDNTIQVIATTDPGFLSPFEFGGKYAMGRPGVESGPENNPVLLWNSTDPWFGAYAYASWPPAKYHDLGYVFNVSAASYCTDINAVMTDSNSCRDGIVRQPQINDKLTAHIRKGFTILLLNSTRVETRNCAIHGAPGFAISEYDGEGAHLYSNVSVRRRISVNKMQQHSYPYDLNSTCGLSNPTGGRLCFGLISSNNDGLHSSGCKYGPKFIGGEISYCLDDWINIHSRAQVFFEKTGEREMVILDPRLKVGSLVRDDFPYGNVETMTNAKYNDQMSFYISGNLSLIGKYTIASIRRASWSDDLKMLQRAQNLLDTCYNKTAGLDVGMFCRSFGCKPRAWYVTFHETDSTFVTTHKNAGIVASLDSWRASGGEVRNSKLHHGRFGIRWKSSNGVIDNNNISARYVEISPLEYYMEGPFTLKNISVVKNRFSECSRVDTLYPRTLCANRTNLPIGYWCNWVEWGGGCGGTCKAASLGTKHLNSKACMNFTIRDNYSNST